MALRIDDIAVNSLISASLCGCFFSPTVMAQSEKNVFEPMSEEALNLSTRQAALTVCALRKLDMDYKVALKTSAVPVFQLVKFKHGMSVEGVTGKIRDERLIRYLGYKISELTLASCEGLLPPEVGASMQKIKTRLGS